MNKRFRKIICLLSASVMSLSLFAFTACGDDDGSDKYTVASRAKELAENVDKIPNIIDIMEDSGGISSVEGSNKKGAAKASLTSHFDDAGMVDMTAPDQGYYDGSYYNSEYEFYNEQTESYINEFKMRKEIALDKLKQLNTWVHVSDGGYETVIGGTTGGHKIQIFGSEDYKLSYDKTCDVATIEYRHNGWPKMNCKRYLKMQCSYNANGNAVISASYHYETGRNEGANTFFNMEYAASVHYVENESWSFICKNQIDNFRYMLYADLKTGDLIRLADHNNVSMVNGFFEYRLFTKDNDIKVMYDCSDLGMSFPEKQSGVTLFDGDGHLLMTINNIYNDFYYILDNESVKLYYKNENGGEELVTDLDKFLEKYDDELLCAGTIVLPVYKVKGWDKLYCSDRYVFIADKYLLIGEEEYSSLESYSCDVCDWRLQGFGNNNEVGIGLYDFKQNGKKYSEIVEEYLSGLGLSFEISDLSFVDKFCGNAWEAVEDIKIAGYSLSDLSLEVYLDLIDKYFYGELSVTEMDAIFEPSAISLKKQKAENEVFALIDISVSNKVVLNEQTGEVDFSSVSATVPKSVLLNEGTEYLLVIALRSGNELKEVTSISATFSGEQFSIGGFGSSQIGQLIDDGDYDLVAYIAKKSGDGNERLSQFYNIVSLQPAEYLKQWQDKKEEGNKVKTYNYTCRISATETCVTVSRYYMISISNK